MKRLTIGLWKEWRDHRGVLLGLLGAIPLLTFLGFWAFAEEFEGARVWSVTGWFLSVSLVLLLFSVAADLVAGETRRGTMALVRRLPRSMVSSFVVKLSFLVVSVATVTVVQMGSLAAAWALFIGDGRGQAVFDSLASFPGGQVWAQALGVMLLMSWTLVTSTWLGRSGAAAVASILVLALIALPWALLHYWHPYFLRFDESYIPSVVAIFAVLALVVAAVSYLRGLRFHAAAWRPAAYGAVCLFVITGASYGYAQARLDSWLDLDPADEDFFIHDAYYGAGGHKLYLNVYRNHPWYGGAPAKHLPRGGSIADERGTPMQAWVVDLESGSIDKQAIDGLTTFNLPMDAQFQSAQWGGFHSARIPIPLLVRYRIHDDKLTAVDWVDARTGALVDTLPPRVRNEKTEALLRDALRESAYVRDSKGRRVWLRELALEREGEERPIEPGVRAIRGASAVPTPDGWHVVAFGRNKIQRTLIDYETGEEHQLPMHFGAILSRDWSLMGNRTKNFELVPLQGQTGVPQIVNPPQFTVQCVARDAMLALRGPKAKYRLELWNPLTGETQPVAWPGVDHLRGNDVLVRGRDRHGRPLLSVRRGANVPFRYVWGVLDVASATVRPLREGGPGESVWPLVLDDDGSLVAVEDYKRVVRYGPNPDVREVLFPR